MLKPTDMKTAVLSNLNSRGVARRLPQVRGALSACADVDHYVTEDEYAMSAALDAADLRANDLLVVHGGDGTAQRVLTWFAEHLLTRDWPRLALLPSGSTNMSAYDVNRHRRFSRCLQELQWALEHHHDLPLQRRTPVAVAGHFERQLGFFFGSGSIVQGIEYFHAHVAKRGARHEAGAGLALLRTVLGIARKQAPFDQVMQMRFCGDSEPIAIRRLGN